MPASGGVTGGDIPIALLPYAVRLFVEGVGEISIGGAAPRTAAGASPVAAPPVDAAPPPPPTLPLVNRLERCVDKDGDDLSNSLFQKEFSIKV